MSSKDGIKLVYLKWRHNVCPTVDDLLTPPCEPHKSIFIDVANVTGSEPAIHKVVVGISTEVSLHNATLGANHELTHLKLLCGTCTNNLLGICTIVCICLSGELPWLKPNDFAALDLSKAHVSTPRTAIAAEALLPTWQLKHLCMAMLQLAGAMHRGASGCPSTSAYDDVVRQPKTS